MRPLLPIAAAACALACGSPAFAQDLATAKVACNDMSNTYSLDAQIAGCTILIQSGGLGGVGLASVYYNRGIEYDQKGDHDRAIADYSEAIRLRPNYPVAFYNRGVVYGEKGDDDRAIADYSEAIRLRPNYFEPHLNRANAYRH